MGRLEKSKSSAEAVRRQRATPQALYLQREKSKSCNLKRLQDAGAVERGSQHRTAQQQAALGNSAHDWDVFNHPSPDQTAGLQTAGHLVSSQLTIS